MKLLKKLGIAYDRVIKFMFYVAAVIIGLECLLVLIMVAFRNLHIQILGVLEIIEYSLLWVAFLATAWLLKIDKHVTMDIVVSHLKPRASALLNIITSSLVVIICLVLAWYSLQLTWELYQTGYTRPGAPLQPMYPIIVIVPVGFFLLFIQSLRRTYGYITVWRAS